MKKCVLLLIAFFAFSYSPASAAPLELGPVRYEHLGDYSVERLNKIITEERAAFSAFKVAYPPAQNAVSLFSQRLVPGGLGHHAVSPQARKPGHGGYGGGHG